jgi:hypothetical protein
MAFERKSSPGTIKIARDGHEQIPSLLSQQIPAKSAEDRRKSNRQNRPQTTDKRPSLPKTERSSRTFDLLPATKTLKVLTRRIPSVGQALFLFNIGLEPGQFARGQFKSSNSKNFRTLARS